MTVARPQVGDEGLGPATIRVSLAGPLVNLVYPRTCPNCGATASVPIEIEKVFSYNHNDDGGWQHRIARAEPLFCEQCLMRHLAEKRPVTLADRLRSVFLTELAVPGIGMLAFGLFLLIKTGAKIARDPIAEAFLAGAIAALLLIGLLCLRAAWTVNGHRRVPTRTATSLAFDFGDDQSTAFQTVPRTYGFLDADYATAFAALNGDRSRVLLGSTQRRRETRRTIITGAIVLGIATAAWWFDQR